MRTLRHSVCRFRELGGDLEGIREWIHRGPRFKRQTRLELCQKGTGFYTMKYPVSEIATVFMCCVLFLLAVYTWVSGWPVDYVGYVSNRTDHNATV